jgi:DNA-binding NarL/FixJ family response regulator
MAKGAIRTILVDGDAVFTDEVCRVVQFGTSVALVGVYPSAGAAREALAESSLAVDAAIVALEPAEAAGIGLIRDLARLRPEIQCVALTTSGREETVLEALRAGAIGYLLKSDDAAELLNGIVEVARGGSPMSPEIARRMLGRLREADAPAGAPSAAHLTAREEEVLNMLARGLTYAMIAHALGIGTGTVQTYVKAIYRKLEIGTKAEAAAEAYRRGLL